ncbi:hypothetical protein [uncultured Photobacterium sp.]|uniref:hypothetical protein n=1 Tax=uncultured Photobacterium sp. TaxID=173973 RepID=UPI0026371B66|nr:hypothetical protein [uncultured Photobacterium sp.]
MSQQFGRYIMASDVVVPTGMNIELAVAVAKADLGRFTQYESPNTGELYTVARADFLAADDLQGKTHELLSIMLNSLLSKLPSSLKPLPLLLSLPSSVSQIMVQEWLESSEYAHLISNIQVSEQGGNRFVRECIEAMKELDVLVCIAVDSLFEQIDDLIEQSCVMSKSNPWGVIPSEGAAGMVLTKKSIVETLKLRPQASVLFASFDLESNDRRGCTRLVRKASKYTQQFGQIYSDMTNERSHIEDYGFAIGARSECFAKPQDAILTNEWWGTLGRASGIATVATFAHLHDDPQPGSLMLFDQLHSRSLLQLQNCGGTLK